MTDRVGDPDVDWAGSEPRPAPPRAPHARDAVSAVYARFYPALAVGVLFLIFQPLLQSGYRADEQWGALYNRVDDGDDVWSWRGVLALAVALIVLLAVLTVRARHVELPIAAAVVAVVLLILLGLRPLEDEPQLSRFGWTGVFLTLATAAVAAAHAVHLASVEPGTGVPRQRAA